MMSAPLSEEEGGFLRPTGKAVMGGRGFIEVTQSSHDSGFAHDAKEKRIEGRGH